MAAQRTLHPEWLASHDRTNYPFSQTGTLRNATGDVIDPGVFLDAMFYPVAGQAGGYLSSVEITNDDVILQFGDNETLNRCLATFSKSSPPDTLRVLDAFGRSAGVIVSETVRLGVFSSWSVGVHRFLSEETPLVARVWAPTPNVGVRGILLDDGTILTGDIWLVGSDGVVLSCEELEVNDVCGKGTKTQHVIRVDIVGDPLWRRRLCADPDDYESKRFLQQITFTGAQKTFSCVPSAVGDIKIGVGSHSTPDTILRIRAVPDGLFVEAVGEILENIR